MPGRQISSLCQTGTVGTARSSAALSERSISGEERNDLSIILDQVCQETWGYQRASIRTWIEPGQQQHLPSGRGVKIRTATTWLKTMSIIFDFG